MNNISVKSSAKVLDRLYMLLVIVFLYFVIFSGWSRVILGPQYAYFVNDVEVLSDATIDNQSVKMKTMILASKPKPFLVGINELIFEMQTPKGGITYKINEDELLSSYKNQKDITLKKENFGFDVAKDFPNINAEYCNSKLDISNSTITGTLSINKFKRIFKKITLEGVIIFDGTFVIDSSCPVFPTLIQERRTHNINTNSIPFSLDSKIIFEWSSKGAETYRL